MRVSETRGRHEPVVTLKSTTKRMHIQSVGVYPYGDLCVVWAVFVASSMSVGAISRSDEWRVNTMHMLRVNRGNCTHYC
jgi:hypothetical protein